MNKPFSLVLVAIAYLVMTASASLLASDPGISGLEVIDRDFVFYDAKTDAVRNMPRPPVADPVFFYLSKEVYPAEDRCLDIIVWLDTRLTNDQATGSLEIRITDTRDNILFESTLSPIPGRQLFFSIPFGPELFDKTANIQLTWRDNGKQLGTARRTFQVLPPSGVPTEGRISIDVPNPDAIRLEGVPLTVGVPFPRGALIDTTHLRLIDEQNREVPTQVKTTAHWSRFGSIKWILLDFEANLQGRPARYTLEYGPGVSRSNAESPTFAQTEDNGFPTILGGRLRINKTGLSARADLSADFIPWLDNKAIHGAFVQHENGARYLMDSSNTHWEIEEAGPVKAVIRATGSYTRPRGQDCVSIAP